MSFPDPNGGKWNGLGGHVSPAGHREGDGRWLDLQSPKPQPGCIARNRRSQNDHNIASSTIIRPTALALCYEVGVGLRLIGN
jgi:hypothetical protein